VTKKLTLSKRRYLIISVFLFTAGSINFELQVEVPNTSLVFNGLDITTISDDDLYNQLQSFGIPVGPIVGE
jgi:hypothetical protein